MSINFAGKVGVGSAAPTMLNWPVTTVTAVEGALLELESSTPEVFDGTGDVFALTQSAIASADTSAEVSLVSKGTKLLADFGIDTLTQDGGATAVFTDSSCVGGANDMFIGAKLLITACAGTASAVGKEYDITDYVSATGAFTLDGGPTFADGDTAKITHIEGTGTKLVGMTTPVLDSTASYVKADGTWNGDDFMVIGAIAPNKLLLTVINSVF